MRRILVSDNTALRCTMLYVVGLYMLYCLSVGDSPPYGRLSCRSLYTSLSRWKFWTVVWENTNCVHFRAVWKNTAHVQGIRCSPEGSHLIPWTSVVFSNSALKWTPFAYRIIEIASHIIVNNWHWHWHWILNLWVSQLLKTWIISNFVQIRMVLPIFTDKLRPSWRWPSFHPYFRGQILIDFIHYMSSRMVNRWETFCHNILGVLQFGGHLGRHLE